MKRTKQGVRDLNDHTNKRQDNRSKYDMCPDKSQHPYNSRCYNCGMFNNWPLDPYVEGIF